MASQTVVTFTHGTEANADIQNLIKRPSGSPRQEANALINYLAALASGSRIGKFDLQIDGGDAVAATGTVVFSGAGAANDTVIINGVTFTGKASGATGNEYNVGASATTSAAALAAAVNASVSALIAGVVTANPSTGTVTFTAANKGVQGNLITIAKGVDGGSVMTVSGARLTGGAAATANLYSFGL